MSSIITSVVKILDPNDRYRVVAFVSNIYAPNSVLIIIIESIIDGIASN